MQLRVARHTNKIEYEEIMKRINNQQIEILESKNPYWNENGTTIKDPDGFFVIISPLKIVPNEIL